MNAEKKAKIRNYAERAHLLFRANPDWTWVSVPGDGRPTADDIYKEFRRMAKETRTRVRSGEDTATLSLGRLTVRSYYVGNNYDTEERQVVTEFCVETGYVI